MGLRNQDYRTYDKLEEFLEFVRNEYTKKVYGHNDYDYQLEDTHNHAKFWQRTTPNKNERE